MENSCGWGAFLAGVFPSFLGDFTGDLPFTSLSAKGLRTERLLPTFLRTLVSESERKTSNVCYEIKPYNSAYSPNSINELPVKTTFC